MLSAPSSVLLFRKVCRIIWCRSALGPDMGMAASPPKESAGLLMEDCKLLPVYELVMEVAKAISFAFSRASSHS